MVNPLHPNLPIILDGKPVEKITAFLFHAGGNNDPQKLIANEGKSFVGSYVLGMGFTFDDGNPDATPITEIHRLIERDPRNQERIFPYIGGEEVNSSPTHAHDRHVINFFDMEEEEARTWSDLMNIVEMKVKPERDVQKRDALRIRWWQYAEKRPGLVKAIESLDRVLVSVQTSKYRTLTFLRKGYVYDQKLVVFAFDTFPPFTILHSRIHEIWSIFFGSSNPEDRPVYAPTEGKRQRKKPWRYRWPEATHDEVLARLLELNQHRHEAEILGGKHAEKKANQSKAKGAKAKKLKGVTVKKQLNLIPPDVEQLDMF